MDFLYALALEPIITQRFVGRRGNPHWSVTKKHPFKPLIISSLRKMLRKGVLSIHFTINLLKESFDLEDDRSSYSYSYVT